MPFRGGAATAEGRNDQVFTFLALAFAWAWGWWGYWLWAMPAGGLQLSLTFLLMAMIGGAAPSLAALVLAWRDGTLKSLVHPLLDWRIGWRNFGLCVGLVPVVTIIASAAVGLVIQMQPPEPALAVAALAWPLIAALGEELGWRGWLLPRLSGRMGLLPASILLGLLWGLWHLPADFIGLKHYGGWFWLAFLINGPVVLTAHSVIAACIWQRSSSRRSLFAAVLYHASVTASAILAPVSDLEAPGALIPATLTAGLLWTIALDIARSDVFAGESQDQTS